jgi:DNA repair exonuclease SbcCD ATPase subunit
MIKRLEIKNIGSYDQAIVEFFIGKNIIHGENGSGKSTLVKAILFGLFGDFNLIPDIKPFEIVTIGKRSGHIVLEFTNPNRTETYTITRNLSVTKRGDSFSISQDASIRTTAGTITGVENTRKKVEEILGIDGKMFVNTVVGTQGNISDIVRSGTASHIFDQLFGIKEYEIAWKEFRGVIKILENKKVALESLIAELRASAGRSGDLQKKLDESRSELERLTQWVKQQEENIAKDDRIDTIETEIETLERKISHESALITRNETSITDLEKKLGMLDGDKCPTCEQDLESDYKDEITTETNNKIERLKTEKEKAETGLVSIEGELSESKTNLRDVKGEIDAKKNEISEKSGVIKTLETNLIPELERELDQINLIDNRINEKAEELNKTRRDIQLAKTIRSAYREVKPILRKGRISAVTGAVNRVFASLFGTNFSISIDPEDYTLFIGKEEDKRSMRTVSGGEGVNLGLALRLAIVESVGKQDVLVLDEPTESLDDHRKELLIDLLDNLKTNVQMIVVSHSPLLISTADTLISVEKEGNTSKVVSK